MHACCCSSHFSSWNLWAQWTMNCHTGSNNNKKTKTKKRPFHSDTCITAAAVFTSDSTGISFNMVICEVNSQTGSPTNIVVVPVPCAPAAVVFTSDSTGISFSMVVCEIHCQAGSPENTAVPVPCATAAAVFTSDSTGISLNNWA